MIGNHPETELPTQVLTGTATLDFGSIAAVASEGHCQTNTNRSAQPR